MLKKEKETLVQELTEKIKNNQGIVVTEYQGLTVAEISELRAKLRPLKCEYKVVKNTLSKRALKSAGLEDFAVQFEGPTAIAIENGDPVNTAKVLIDFSKEHAKLKLKAGMLGNKVLTEKDIKALAALPSKEVLIGNLLRALQSPMSGLVNVLQGNIRNVVYVLEAVRKQKEQQA
jgi:large subunit ribosomal protein L10